MLNPLFRIVTTQSLADTTALVAEHHPSLVLIDMTDDERAVRQLTKTLQGEHGLLPVVHLSAYDDNEQQLRSLRAGAADYVMKPFSKQVLIERITKIIERTTVRGRELPEQAGDAAKPLQQGLLTNVEDKYFIDRFQSLLASHIDDPNLSVEQLASLMNLGRVQFYKKVKALTGETPVQHLHRARLDYAARLLRETTATIEEVMNRAGFSSPTHFYNAFKRQFGLSPRKYRSSPAPFQG